LDIEISITIFFISNKSEFTKLDKMIKDIEKVFVAYEEEYFKTHISIIIFLIL